MKRDYIRYPPSEISAINTAKPQIFNNTLTEDSLVSLLISYLDSIFDALHAASGKRYADGNDERLVILYPIASLSNYMLTTRNGEHVEDISHSHTVFLMFKIITSAKNKDDPSCDFDGHRRMRQQELTASQNKKLKVMCDLCLKMPSILQNIKKKIHTA